MARVDTLSLNGDLGGSGGGTGWTTMSAWEAVAQSTFNNTEPWDLECNKDFGPTGLNDNVLADAWIVSPTVTNPVTIKAAAGSEHNGVIASGFVMVSTIADNTLRVDMPYFVIQDVQFDSGAGTTNLQFRSDNGLTQRCISKLDAAVGTAYGFYANATAPIIRNCLAISINNPGTGTQYGYQLASAGDLYNCTAIGFKTLGFNTTSSISSRVSKNCVAYNNALDFSSNCVAATFENNASGDASAVGTGCFTGVVAADFVNYQADATGDYSPAPGQQLDGQINPGQIILGYTDDIANITRDDPWEIGAYAIAGAPAGALLTSGTVTGETQTTATIGCTTDTAGGTLYWYVSLSATPPSPADLKAGTGSVDFGNQVPGATGPQTAGATGLTANTQYWHYWIQVTA